MFLPSNRSHILRINISLGIIQDARISYIRLDRSFAIQMCDQVTKCFYRVDGDFLHKRCFHRICCGDKHCLNVFFAR